MIWSSNTMTSREAIARLHDNGNLVVIDRNNEVIWQSFDHPTDTLLPSMKLGRSYLWNKEWHLSSWKSSQDPAPGEFTYGVDTTGYPNTKIRQGTLVKFRDGPWRNNQFDGFTESRMDVSVTYNVVIDEGEVSFAYNVENSSILSRTSVNSSGHLESWAWVDDGRGWQLVLSLPSGICDQYNTCNAYGTCTSVNKLVQQNCTCLDEKRFVPKNQEVWDTADWSDGCIRRTPLDCGSDGFVNYTCLKLPDTENTLLYMNMSLDECATRCRNNCSCMAYANPDPSRMICVLWFNDLLDIQVLPQGSDGLDIFIRMASSELDDQSNIKREKEGANIILILLVTFMGVLFIGLIITTWLCYARRKRDHAAPTRKGEMLDASKDEDMEQPLFSFSTIANATANFSINNKLGEGGFGPVYKGTLEEGQEIAVKRLSKNSSQGLEEFKNEVICISRLQHRNLVKILGCCVEGDEKLLIYEYMPNKSLDSFIFDKTQRALLDWSKLFNIIKGIARGLVYLHHDSRLRIIHRDLKAGNILLDQDMNPKISDFGLARSFGGNEIQANTNRVVGTYGYMSPEYAQEGLFSIKSDVFSFGVLVLEIVSGKRNRGFFTSEYEHNFIEYVWSMYNEGRSMELIDSSYLELSCNPREVIRSIHVGLLCVQHNAKDRPNMSSVILMLGGEGELPQPKHPSFFMEKQLPVANFFSSTYTGVATNITGIYAR
ncbi:hypothetical protein QVD17_39063 [Tagetes erecta]|uniref:Receptor-like serine/threonine-protein kinase n=1 Tax=Tagetes erecta TaxID=13708 RepID=A0AAD8NFX1_TARER|nr:hypothetical protein QVD17_39063 [Tagetes erecta]